MKAGVVLMRITAGVLGLQLLLGGLLTFGFISAEAHILVGFLLLLLATGTMAAWFMTEPAFRPMRVATAVIVLLLLVQGALGFAALGTKSDALSLLHFLDALAVFGATISGSFIAMRWAGAPRGGTRAG
ncbi:MAG: hypothetical protein JRN58_06410 [Nitrososphaerota archaeon]|jgi:hypothetical protein|nr:hypothetical protein [Nitrososphaerota archaeon]MDG6966890.1 hypothetical protein [Nitrososphaerota archaeon]MDG6978694.1 hypothetical protein [Nitrososphaerota archaeon]